MADEAPLLRVDDLSVRFGAAPAVVDGISFGIGRREILGLVGESGSGKSLTSLAILGLVPAPGHIAGRMLFDGRDLLTLAPKARRSLRGGDIAMIFQDPMSALTPVYTIGWQIDEQLRAHRALSRSAARSRSLALLDAMGVREPRRVAASYPHQLSGGLRQRAMIAMALSCDPKLLIADEPTTALDVTVQAQILELILKLRGDFGSSVLIITHDMGVVGRVADRVAVMYAGRLVEQGPRQAVLATPAHPYTRSLLDSVPRLYGPRPARLKAIPGLPPQPAERPPGCPFQPRCAHAQPECAAPPLVGLRGGHEAVCILPARAGASA